VPDRLHNRCIHSLRRVTHPSSTIISRQTYEQGAEVPSRAEDVPAAVRHAVGLLGFTP
jgi:hypothetical protein